MAILLRRHWSPTLEGLSRRDRRGCDFEAYVPDPLEDWNLSLPADLVADLGDSETAVRKLNQTGTSHGSLEGLARFLLRAESVASSRIEGLEAGPRRLIEAEAEATMGGGHISDRVAAEILGNISAMEAAIDTASARSEFTVTDLLAIHRTLMLRSASPDVAGVVRDEQNWIGGSSYNPCSAAFIPPPPEHVQNLLTDLVAYMNSDEHAPLVQAALTHAQFETIHPFADGNGRTGRALIHVILRRRGVAPTFVPPISLVLATWSRDYVAALTAFRHLGPAEGAERSVAVHPWLRTFASATSRACIDAETYSSRIAALVEGWTRRLGPVRAGSALDLLLRALPGAPLVTTSSAADLINRSTVAVGSAINRLIQAGILVQRNAGRQRYRVYEAPEVIGLFTALERALASPTGDTATAPPTRRVPR